MANALKHSDPVAGAKYLEVMKNVVLSLKPEDVVDEVEVGGTTWDVSKFTRPDSVVLIAHRTVNGELELGAVSRTLEEIEEALTAP